MRFILFTSKLNFETAGGSVMDLHLKARGLKELGHEVSVVTVFSGANKAVPTDLPYKLFEEDVHKSGLLGIQRGIYKLLKKYASLADVFYIDGHMFLYGGGLYRWLGGKVPVAAFFNIRLNAWGDTHGTASRKGIWKKIKVWGRWWLERLVGVPVANHLDAFVFNTPMVRKLYGDFGFDMKKSSIVEDFVDTALVIKNHQITPAFLEARQNKSGLITFFASGRMFPEKGFDLLIKGMARLSDRRHYRLAVSGTGPEADRLKQMVKDSGLNDIVSFPGWITKEQLADFFLRSQIFVFPKWWLEYGSALLTEAMAFGLPCIVPRGGALEWLAKGGALTFQNDNEEELARVMTRLGEDVGLRRQLSAASLKRAKDLDCRILAKRLEEIMRRVAGRTN